MMKDDSQPFVSICVLNYNGRAFIDACLRSLDALDYPRDRVEVLFVDNASNDGSVEHVQQTFPRARVLQWRNNEGFARGNNLAIQYCRGKYVIFLNNDTEVDRAWLTELVNAAQQFPHARIFGSKLFIHGKRQMLNSAGCQITKMGAGYDKGFGKKDTDEFSRTGEVSAVSGASMMVEKQYFQDLGMFDETYFMYFEDVDVCLRAWVTGGECVFVSTSHVMHRVGATSGRHRSNFRNYFSTRNRLYTLLKNFQWHTLVLGVVSSVCFDVLFSFLYVLRGNLRAPFVILKAYAHVLVTLPSVLTKRRTIQKRRTRSDRDLSRIGVLDSIFRSAMEALRLMRSI